MRDLGRRRETAEVEPLHRYHVVALPHRGPPDRVRAVVEDEVPRPVAERLDESKAGARDIEAELRFSYPHGGVIGMLEVLQEIVRKEPPGLPIVHRRVAVLHHQDVALRDHGDVRDELVGFALHGYAPRAVRTVSED